MKHLSVITAVAIGLVAPTAAQVSEDVQVTLTVQTEVPDPIALSGLDDVAVSYDGMVFTGVSDDSFCLYAGEEFLLTLVSANGVGADFFLAAPGAQSNIVYDVDVTSDFGSGAITSDGLTFDHDVQETIDGTGLSTDPNCAEGDNMLLELSFPTGSANGIDVVSANELSDGATYTYSDLLTMTLTPSL
ncbi:MAG: hypothetical protein QNI84_11440 [Henriciella sp.]|nr:hypothetical protein [Henriciella sp.]